VRLVLKGEAFGDNHVPVNILADKLQALQNLLFHAAAAVVSEKAPRRGRWQNRFREIVELAFVEAHHSELVLDLALPDPPEDLHSDADISLQALALVFEAGSGLLDTWSRLTLAPEDRDYLLKAFEALAPGPLDDYQVIIENGAADKHRKLAFTRETRRNIRGLFRKPKPIQYEEEVVIVGELVKIHVDASPETVTVRVKGREVDCYYPPWLRDEVTNLLAGSLVEVSGIATFDQHEQVVRIDQVSEIVTVDMEPVRVVRFEHHGTRYNLRKPIAVQLEYVDGLWVYHNEQLNLWGSGERREDAMRDLNENFAFLWREYAEEKDEVLDEMAYTLKQRLVALRKEDSAKAG
jgi:hypothetical protein